MCIRDRVKILPILIGVLVSYAVALVTGAVDFQRISEAAWVGIPLHKEAMGCLLYTSRCV